MISIKPKWCALEMNGKKTIEVRSNKALVTAIQKLIDENGYADIYAYCSKDEYLYRTNKGYFLSKKPSKIGKVAYSYEGKVIFKFRCYNVEEIKFHILTKTNTYGVQRIETTFTTQTLSFTELKKLSCLAGDDLMKYLNDADGYAIHISDLEIFDRPRELCEFMSLDKKNDLVFKNAAGEKFTLAAIKYLEKAPQNFCYIEVE